MKRIFLLSVLAIMPLLSLNAQLQGDGSMANPYRGFLVGNFTISGTKYFNGNIYVDDETLTIAPGTKLIAVQARASIFVINTGKLTANGTSAYPILFTCDLDLDGINGEPSEYWGNITIESSQASQISYCTFERGRKDHAKFGLFGGGLRLASSAVTVTNTTFLNCLASKGGAIAVLAGKSPNITSCTFLNNSSIDQGGAVYVEAASSPVFTNCLFRNNSSASPSLKGGTIASLSSSPKIINSTIVYSTSPASEGKSIYLENSSGAVVVNSAIWGGTNHIGLSGTPSSVLANNAIEGVSVTGNITLNSSNTATDGPNFTNPSSGDFSIAFISPMRDTGTESYPGVTIPSTDITGTTRIHIRDIGAYESIYSRWNGNRGTSWPYPRNWDSDIGPGTTNIVIPAGRTNYPTASPGVSFTLNSGLQMIVEPGARVTFSSLTNNGTIWLKANAAASASLIAGSYSGSAGSMNVEIFLKGSGEMGDLWHYIAAPATVPKTVFTDIEPENLMNYDEGKVVTDVIEGWQWHDGYDGTTPFTNLEAKKGYNVLVFNDTTLVFRNLQSITTSMGQIDLPFSGSGGDTSLYGYSLVGNSLTCGLNWDLVTRSDQVNVRNAIYFRQGDVVASYVNGVGTNGGSAHIPPLQGFFVKTRATGTYITIPNNAREHNSTVRYKSSQTVPMLSLTLVSDQSQDETVIRFEPRATEEFDGDYDAGKIFSPSDKNPQVWSVLNGENYSINSIPLPETEMTIPLTVRIPVAGTYKIKRSQLQGAGGARIELADALTGSRTDLTNTSLYTFSAGEGTIANRFSIIITTGQRTEPEQKDLASALKIYSSSGKICILPEGREWSGTKGNVRIFDVTGRLIMSVNEERFSPGELKEYSPSVSGGLLIVEVNTAIKRFLEKIVLTE